MINGMRTGLFRFLQPASTKIPDAVWVRSTAPFDFIARLPVAEQHRLRSLSEQFIARREWHGAAGFTLTDEVIVAIAAQACLPVLHLSLDLYDSFVGVVVYPSGFRVPKTEVDEAGVLHEWTEEASGEAWSGGPVVLSWEDASSPDTSSGYNVVIHEFAHKLDMADNIEDGIPVLDPRFHGGIDRSEFAHVLSDAYLQFCAALDALPTDTQIESLWGIDVYAAEHPVEFFAVSVEFLLSAEGSLTDHTLWQWFALLRKYLCLPAQTS
jgi:MtfA peptidase